MTTKKSFLFYHNWDEQIELMTEAELRNFIKNLIRYDKGEDVILNTKEDKLCWLGIVSGLEINKQKWITKSENGKLGGAPRGNKNAIKEKQPLEEKSISGISDQEKNNRKQPKTTETSVNSKQLIDNSKLETEKTEGIKEERKQENENGEFGPSTGLDAGPKKEYNVDTPIFFQFDIKSEELPAVENTSTISSQVSLNDIKKQKVLNLDFLKEVKDVLTFMDYEELIEHLNGEFQDYFGPLSQFEKYQLEVIVNGK